MAMASSTMEDTVDNIKEALQPLKDKYDDLPPKGKFGIGAIGGFACTKMTVGTTVKVAKITGAAFIISEVLNQAGVFEMVSLPEQGDDMILAVRKKVSGAVNDCRLAVRKHLSVDKFRSGYESCLRADKMGTLGFTTGAVAGLVW